MLKPFYFCIRISVNKIRIYADIYFGILSSWVDGDYITKCQRRQLWVLSCYTLVRWSVGLGESSEWGETLFILSTSKTTASDLHVWVQLRPDTVISVIWRQCLASPNAVESMDSWVGEMTPTGVRPTDQHLTGSGLGGGCWIITTCPCGHSLLT